MKEYLDLIRTLADLGGSAAVATVMIVCIYKLFKRFAVAFIGNMEKIAVSMSDQAKSMQDLSESINLVIGRDNAEHREILLGMQVVGEELKSLVTEIRCLREGRAQ